MTLLSDMWDVNKKEDLDALAKAALWELRDVDIYKLNSYAYDNNEIFNALYKAGKIDEENIEKSLREAVIKRGKVDCTMMTLPRGCLGFLGVNAYRLGMPELLAYCITEDVFPKEVLRKIHLKRGKTIESFVKEYRQEDLLIRLRENLLHPYTENPIPDMSYLTTYS